MSALSASEDLPEASLKALLSDGITEQNWDGSCGREPLQLPLPARSFARADGCHDKSPCLDAANFRSRLTAGGKPNWKAA